jgi:DNA polymerase I-like protein with 3'-5' exonuclease and polymerase domains
MKTRIVGQIHDSIVADVHLAELDEYLLKAKQVMTLDVRNAWRWVITDLEIEAEVAYDNWFNKKAVEV